MLRDERIPVSCGMIQRGEISSIPHIAKRHTDIAEESRALDAPYR